MKPVSDDLISFTDKKRQSKWQVDTAVCANIKTLFVHSKHSQMGIVQQQGDGKNDSGYTATVKMHMHKPLAGAFEKRLRSWDDPQSYA